MTKKSSSEESKARDKKLSKDLHDSMQFGEILNQNEKQYRDILSGIEDGYYEVDIAGNLSFFNDSLCKIYGYARDELIGMNNREYMAPATAKKAYLVFNGVYKTGEPTKIFDWEFLKKDGTKIDIEISISLIKNLKGDAVGFRGIVRDIGERKLIEAALKKTHEELEGRVVERTRDLIKINKRLEQEITIRKQTEEALKESERRYRELSIIDKLTQLYNSGHFYNQLNMEIDRANRYKEPITLILIDVDNFKAFNDTYGHVEGDQVLKRLGQVFKRCLRKTDSAYRYGGEEFIILLSVTKIADGVITAERIRTEFKEENFSPVSGKDVHLTVSIGVSQYKPQEEMKVFVHRADQLMYKAKKDGKDRVCYES